MVSTFAIPVSSSPHRIISNQAWLAEVCIMKSSTTLSPCVAKSYYECHDSAGFTYNKECEAGTQYDESSRQCIKVEYKNNQCITNEGGSSTKLLECTTYYNNFFLCFLMIIMIALLFILLF